MERRVYILETTRFVYIRGPCMWVRTYFTDDICDTVPFISFLSKWERSSSNVTSSSPILQLFLCILVFVLYSYRYSLYKTVTCLLSLGQPIHPVFLRNISSIPLRKPLVTSPFSPKTCFVRNTVFRIPCNIRTEQNKTDPTLSRTYFWRISDPWEIWETT